MKYCSSACCSSSNHKDKISKYADTEINVSFHLFPRDEVLKGKWEKFIRLKSKYFTKAYANSYLCSNHFERSCFSNFIAVEMGFEQKLKLISGAVPTIHWISRPKAKNSIISDSDRSTTETYSGSKRKSKALVKRNALKRLKSLINDNATVVLVPETTESDLTSVSEVATVADPVKLPVYHMCTSIQTDTFETGNKKVQCNIQSHKRSKYTQCCMTVMKDTGTQTEM
uniref:THAP-type domain-containing protein n=1 Tax=Biomphalaria glabrata TaxID=6526 RepID=A0A2C9KEK5_BIOGL